MYSELAALRIWSSLPTTLAPTELVNEPEVQEFMTWTNELSTQDTHEALAMLTNLLPVADVAPASVLALCCGALVEQSSQATLAFPAVLTHFQRLQELVNVGAPPPAGAFRFTIMALMTMLCRSAANRHELLQQPGLADWLDVHDAISDHFYYLAGMLQVSDEDSIYVLFPEYGTGLEVSVNQVNNVYHLLTLLQPLIVQYQAKLGLRRISTALDPHLLRYAQGLTAERPIKEADAALFNWLNAAAYQGGPLDNRQIAWGELPVRNLPRVQEKVVLLGAALIGGPRRSWDVGFCTTLHAAHRPQVQLQQLLAPETVTQVLEALHPTVRPSLPLAEDGSLGSVIYPGRWWQRLLGRKVT